MPKKKQTIKIIFFGDLVGKPGRFSVRDFLSGEFCNDKRDCYDFVIANVENASHGFGLTEKNYNELSQYGIDCMTSGNHIWDKKEIFGYIDTAQKLIRPFNYPEGTQGGGSRVYTLQNGVQVAVINILGRVFMGSAESPWTMAANEIKRLKEITPVVIVDFHAEATAEKICFARFCSELGVSAFFGTHTHVQTADEQIMNNMGYITDAGFCGASESVIGMDYGTSLSRFTTVVPERFEVAQGDVNQINAVEAEIDVKTGYTVGIKRVFCSRNVLEKDEKHEM